MYRIEDKYQFLTPSNKIRFLLSVMKKSVLSKTHLIHLVLFIATVITTLIVGAELRTNKYLIDTLLGNSEGLHWNELIKGIPYSVSLILFLLFHEFGHFFMAQYYQVACTLPYFIPLYIPFPQILNIGTLGAVIRLKESPKSNIEYFDIGIAGPLSGFMISLIILVIGYTTLPPLDYLYEMNPDYLTLFHRIPNARQLLEYSPVLIVVGHNLLQYFFETTIGDPTRLPYHYELFHYPLLFTGYLTLFFTALNLLPLGQLDGGHILYASLPRKYAKIISRTFLTALILYGGAHYPFSSSPFILFEFLLLALLFVFNYYALNKMMPHLSHLFYLLIAALFLCIQVILGLLFPWKNINLLWILYTYLVIRFIGIDHPPFQQHIPLNQGRKILAIIALIIFLLCFTMEPIYVVNSYIFEDLYGSQ